MRDPNQPFSSFSRRTSPYVHHAGSMYRYVASKPSWVSRIAAMVFLFIIVLPVLVLVLLAVLLAVTVFGVLAFANALAMPVRDAIRRLLGGGGRGQVSRGTPADAPVDARFTPAIDAWRAGSTPGSGGPGAPGGPEPAADAGVAGSATRSAEEARNEARPAGDGPTDAEGRRNVRVVRRGGY